MAQQSKIGGGVREHTPKSAVLPTPEKRRYSARGDVPPDAKRARLLHECLENFRKQAIPALKAALRDAESCPVSVKTLRDTKVGAELARTAKQTSKLLGAVEEMLETWKTRATTELKHQSSRKSTKMTASKKTAFPAAPRPEFLRHLDQKGWAVVPNVLTQAECKAMVSGFWNFVEHATSGSICKEDTSTWKMIYDALLPSHGMLIQHWGIGQQQVVWDLVRANPKVIDVFAQIWGNSNLTSSIDAVSFGLPPEVTGRGWHNKGWLHWDQGWGHKSRKPGNHGESTRCAVQGWVTALPVEEGDATLRVLEHSHRFHGEFAVRFPEVKDQNHDWFKLKPEHEQWLEQKGCRAVDVKCPAGSLVLWDSRTVHSGKAPSRGRANKNRLRVVAYVCMTPRAWMSEKDTAKKRKIVLEGRLTSHWPHLVKMFGKHPRTWGKKLPKVAAVQTPALSALAAELVGWHQNPKSCPLLRKPANETASDP